MTILLKILLVMVFTLVYLAIQIPIEKWTHQMSPNSGRTEKRKRKFWSALQMAVVMVVLISVLFGGVIVDKTFWTAEVWMFLMVLCLPVSIRIALFSHYLNKVMGWEKGFIGVTSWWDNILRWFSGKITYQYWYRWIPLIINGTVVAILLLVLS